MNPFNVISRYMQENSTSPQDIWFIVVSTATIALVWVVIMLWDRFRATKAPARPRYETVFLELCQAHKLRDGESHWLQDIAAKNGFDDPAGIFFTPQSIETEAHTEGENARIARTLLSKLFSADAAAGA